MLVFLISCLSVILVSKSLSLEQHLTWKRDPGLLHTSFWKELFCLFISLLTKSWFIFNSFEISSKMLIKKKFLSSKVMNVEETDGTSLLDLPELALDCILEKLQPKELCKMSQVCKSLRGQCKSDHLWERHMKNKWGQLAGQVAYREWKRQSSLMDDPSLKKNTSLIRSLSFACSMSWSKPKAKRRSKSMTAWPVDSIMAWYLSLESGKFWFPAQVYNREHGHVGFLMSCYDAEVCYDSFSDTFQARYPPHGARAPVLEEFVQWERIRAPAIDIPTHNLHISDCLDDLHPGDHIEIQWRRNKEFPYGWWYGVVGHLETCDKIDYLCRCHKSDTILLEFNQYSLGSRWRTKMINRKDHREEGNEIDGFYGGIRKIYRKEEISVWKNLWPKETMQ